MKILVMYSNAPPSPAHLEKLSAIAPNYSVVEASSEVIAIDNAADAEIVLGHRYLWQILPIAERLRWVQSTAAGIDRLLVPALFERRPLLTRCPIFADVVARHALSIALAVIRRIPQAHAAQLRGEWQIPEAILPWPRSALVLGLGSIGSNLASLLRHLGMRVYGMARTVTPQRQRLCDQLVGPDDWKTVLPGIDTCFICLPHSASTEGIFDADALDRLPGHAVVINVGRGSALDTVALAERLREGKLGGAALDVINPQPDRPEDPIWHCPRLLITPKMAVFEPDRQARLESCIEEQLTAYLSDGKLRYRVDLDALA